MSCGVWVWDNGTVINRGTITGSDFSVAFDVGDDTLILQTGSVLNGPADGWDGTDLLQLEGTGTEDDPFLNFERLDMNGANWTLSGDSTFGDGVFVNSGSLWLNGTITANVNVANGALLGGVGTILGDVTYLRTIHLLDDHRRRGRNV